MLSGPITVHLWSTATITGYWYTLKTLIFIVPASLCISQRDKYNYESSSLILNDFFDVLVRSKRKRPILNSEPPK